MTGFYAIGEAATGAGIQEGPAGHTAMAYGDGTTPGLQSVYRSAFGIA